MRGSLVGRSYVETLAAEINGVLERKWNMDRPLCLLAVTLQRSPDVRGASNVRARIKQRLREWVEGNFKCL